MTSLHILAGTLSLIAGALALAAPKGGILHRRSGQVFVVAMLGMAGSGATIAATQGETLSVVAGLLTLYLVGSGWLSLQRDSRLTRGANPALAVLGAVVALLGYWWASDDAARTGSMNPAAARVPMLVFASVALLGVAMDLRVLWRGPLRGVPRLIRHVWRMSLAMWIATASFFLGQPRFLPEPLQPIALRLLPVGLVAAVLAWWLLRLALRRMPRAVARQG